jgi:hypothetical protein
MQYPVAMELKYKTRSRTPRVGMGKTTWMSSSEVIFTADQPIAEESTVEISIAWPALLHNRVALQLVVEGEVTRSQEGEATVRILKHHFRTRGPWQREQTLERPVAAYAAPVQLHHQETACAR